MSQFFDDLARTLATSMPRRRAVRLLGGALVGITFPGAARAARSTHNCAAENAFLCKCPAARGLYFRLCCPNETPTDGYKCECFSDRAQCTHIRCPGGERCGYSGLKCCVRGEYCASQKLELCCKDEERGCGPVCCKPNEECRTARFGTSSQKVCTKRCPQGQAWCGGDKCCPPKWYCRNEATGLCKRCRKNEEECGSKCCDRRTSRCCGKAGCCPKGRSCCVNDKKQVCCPPRHGCAVPILPGNIGIVPKTEAICCPNERLSQSPKLCCPPGQVALNTPGFRTPPPGVSPFCCPPAQICSSASGRACVDFQSDAQNCGSCGNVCSSGECLRGVCVL